MTMVMPAMLFIAEHTRSISRARDCWCHATLSGCRKRRCRASRRAEMPWLPGSTDDTRENAAPLGLATVLNR